MDVSDNKSEACNRPSTTLETEKKSLEFSEIKVKFNDVPKPKEKSNTRVSNPKLKIFR